MAGKLNAQEKLSLLTLGIGLGLVIGRILADSEPGAIPLLLIAVGGGWYLVTRARAR